MIRAPVRHSGDRQSSVLSYSRTVSGASQDSTRNYMTKFLTDKWMQRNKFMSMPETDAPRNTVGSLIETLQLRSASNSS